MKKHKTQTIRGIEIDLAMVPLMKECWRLGWRTEGCCQGVKRFREDASITFEHLEDVLQMWSFIKDLKDEHGYRITVAVKTGAFPDSIEFAADFIELITQHLQRFPDGKDQWLPPPRDVRFNAIQALLSAEDRRLKAFEANL